jgi:Fe-S cluster assembly ATP-binding protein
MLSVKDLNVQVEGKILLRGVSLSISPGEKVALLGPNGAGKTTLLLALLGHPRYKIKKGEIIFKGKNITHFPINERAKMGMAIAFQQPPHIRGVKLRELLHIAADGLSERKIESLAQKVNMREFLEREVNFGFSGGEKKRSEILQLMSMNPDLIMLDEPDSGVDIENIEIIGKALQDFLKGKSALVITHHGHILDYIEVNKAYVLYDGKIACCGEPEKILTQIKEKGYAACAQCEEAKKV